jgi:hypothetical protein
VSESGSLARAGSADKAPEIEALTRAARMPERVNGPASTARRVAGS